MKILKSNDISKELENIIDLYICMDVSLKSNFSIIKQMDFRFMFQPSSIIPNDIKQLI
jgi:hypothetical protein